MQNTTKAAFPKQHQWQQPGSEAQMNPQPQYDNPHYRPAGNLVGKTALITGGDSGIGRAVAIHYAKEGAAEAYTRSLALSLVEGQVRVNAVAPGPVWTPLIVSSFTEGEVATFGADTPMNRAAQPCELAPIYVYLGSDDSTNVSGQVFHVNSGTVIN